MRLIEKMKDRLKDRYTVSLIAVWLVYCALSLTSSQSVARTAERYDIPTLTVIFLLITVLIPLLVIWLYAFSGWRHFYEFTREMKNKLKRKGYYRITLGLFVLAVMLVAPSLIRATYAFLGGDITSPGYIITSKYLNIYLPLLSFGLMYAGSLWLLRAQKQSVPLLTKILNVGVPVVLFTYYYTYMVFSDPVRQTSSDPDVTATYFLSDPMIVLTIVMPLVATWVLGLLFVVNMDHYSRFTNFNRRAIVSFYNGMLLIIGATILSQAFNSLGSSRMQEIGLGMVLVVIFILLGIIAYGFNMVSRGAQQLKAQQKLENKLQKG